jgi:hypothetical protein
MAKKQLSSEPYKTLDDFLTGKSEDVRSMLDHFVAQFKSLGPVKLHPAKTMIGIATPRKRIAYITQIGKNFIHVVFPFEQPYSNNLCFQKIAQVPGDDRQFNHHFRMYSIDDVNPEVLKFMKMAVDQGR